MYLEVDLNETKLSSYLKGHMHRHSMSRHEDPLDKDRSEGVYISFHMRTIYHPEHPIPDGFRSPEKKKGLTS